MPKTASTFLSNAIGALPGIQKKGVAFSAWRREQELAPSRLKARDKIAWVAQHHTRYSDATATLIERHNITPVVLTRDLADCVASLRDHIRNEPRMPMIWLTEQQTMLPDAELEALIADFIMPWYVSFLVSWQYAPDVLRITYDDVRQEPQRAMRMICDRAGIDASSDQICAAIEQARGGQIRFNKGVSGRGAQITPYAKDRIKLLLSRFPGLDASTIARETRGRRTAQGPLQTIE
jgi:hypothetical protein